MKSIRTILALCAFVMAAVSCSYEIEEAFPKTASERLTEREQKCFDLLTGAENGWLVQYYPSATRDFGGCTFGMVFHESGDVDVTSEMAADVESFVTSHFSINTSSSVVLTFDTYNDYIHYWSDPDFFSGNDFDGEFEFAFVDGDETRMEFVGTKTHNTIIFTAVEEDIVAAMKKIKDYISHDYTSYELSVNGITVAELTADYFSLGRLHNVLTYIPDGAESWDARTIPFAYTEDGIRFYEPFELAGEYFQDFILGDDGSLEAVYDGGETAAVMMKGGNPDSYASYDTFIGTYTLTYDSGSTMTWTFEASGDGYSYIVTPSNSSISGYPFSVSWTPYGYLTLNSQRVGYYGSNYLYLCVWDADSGYLNRGTAYGFNLISNGDADNLVLSFEGNGVWQGYDTNSLIYYAYTTSFSGVGTYFRLPYPTALVKIN